MRICKSYEFGEKIKGYHLGWSLAGPPLMSVYFYAFDHLFLDTGQAHMGQEVLEIAGSQQVETIFLTHHHEDHSGNAALIQKATGARVYGHPYTRKKLKKGYKILPYQKYVWGRSSPVTVLDLPRTIDTSLGPMIPVPTPGHSRDHTAYFLPDQGIVFSGDLYLGDRIKFFRADEDIKAQIGSLKKLLELDFDQLLCCHNPRSQKGQSHLKAKLEFLENFYGGVIELFLKGAGEKEIFSRLCLEEDWFTKLFCFGNVSMMNGVKSCIRHYQGH
ncbi:MAG: MBL fold metallo-hydrolase [Desulfobacter sp.]|nr:MBL fold metallo-hydrolase [Desulfobacter sp.]